MDFEKRHLRGKKLLTNAELKIISSLRKNARKKLTEISKEANIPTSSVFDKLKKFEQGLIKNYVSILDFNKIGYHGKANIALKVDKDAKEKLLEFLVSCKNVNSVYRLHNAYDFLVECIFRNIPEVETFVEELESQFRIYEKHIFYVTEDIEREKFLTEVNHI